MTAPDFTIADVSVRALIELTAYGMFFIRDSNYRVWDGDEWRGFGEAERYPTYAAAFKDRRRAVVAALAASQ